MKESHSTRCQVETPHDVVQLVWKLISQQRPNQVFDKVLDLGAGDGRFSRAANRYQKYVGIERDKAKAAKAKMPSNAKLIVADAFAWKGKDFDLCVGNPPYIRHHGLEPAWRDAALQTVIKNGGPALKKTANAFIIFLAQALTRTNANGLVAQVIPYEWVTRPSASELRSFIDANGWSVHVYRFDTNIFPTVLTTASITIIDKSVRDGQWHFGTITRDGVVTLVDHASGTPLKVISYKHGIDKCKALRGLSPGGQEIFVLTEEERLFYSLKKGRDVRPCVTSLRSLEQEMSLLDKTSFEHRFVRTGARCWLIRSDLDKHSTELSRYLESVPSTAWERYSTCTDREIWWRYRPHPAPALLVASGFTQKAPKILVNEVGAVAVGSVYGVLLTDTDTTPDMIANRLRAFDFDERLVHHSNGLKKLEVKQLNSVLSELLPY
ncbi:Eco57I restriction-modification methylase domain-containing protein [Pseudomonas syringae]|uniref:Eco57I restriction-modification methylase domain-containing protein n=1 Tax=Pseudomonas syringae TaxID=317 RepID=UPI003F75F189